MENQNPREHVEFIRKKTFSIGGEKNPLAPMLDQAVKYLSAELYAKDVHFLMELIQNAEDNEYMEGVDPSLEFVITSRDITGTGAPATLLMFNNEKGFSAKNIDSICNVGNSTKKGNRKRGYIGEKGIGFKSVFLITSQPYIFSNGYQIRFDEKPCPHCNLGYIVPEWVEENPSLADIKQIYGPRSGNGIPTTTMVLPLKPDKVQPVKKQLSSIYPEILLFLSKIKHLSVREYNEDPKLNSVSAIAITKETNFTSRKNIDAESYTLDLSAGEKHGDRSERECSYYVWKQKFPVREANRVEKRMEVDEWVITLAFPTGERLHRGMNSPGVYAFLPTEMVTNFPFIIQADFILASSRETILLDNKWNQGILNCVPLAFINALSSLVKSAADAPVSSLPPMFRFLPINSSSYSKLNEVRESIKAMLAEESIVPSESYMQQKFFHKPHEVCRIMPDFWNILKKAKEQGVGLHNLSSHGCYVLNATFDLPEYDEILNFLGVGQVNNEWYANCIKSSNLLMGVSEDVYLQLLLFLADNWRSKFCSTDMGNIPLIKYVEDDGSVSLSSINIYARINSRMVLCLSQRTQYMSWLIYWNKKFGGIAYCFFLPTSMQEAIHTSPKKETVLQWLKNEVKVAELNVHGYAVAVNKHLNGNRRNTVLYAHFLCLSFSKDYLDSREVHSLCMTMPLVDSYGNVTTGRNGVLVPANGSKWVELIGSNPWRNSGYIELVEDYLRSGSGSSVGSSTTLIEFLKTHVNACDIPHVCPPNAGIPTVSAPLTKQNTFLLLDWLRELRYKGTHIPEKFLTCIKQGSWMRITMNGCSGHRPPSQSFLLTSNSGNSKWGNILQHGSVLVDIPLIDQNFYGYEIVGYKEELKTIGVMFEYGEACEFIGDHLMSLAASLTLTRSNVIQILRFIRFLRQNFLSPDEFTQKIKEGRWLKTSNGNRSPVGSVLYDLEWTMARQISQIPFIDQGYYGDEILSFEPELQLLGVIVGFDGNYQLVVDYLKPPSSSTSLPARTLLFVLDCMHHSNSSDKLAKAFKDVKCLRTNMGYKSPGECFLLDPEWGCLLQVFGGVSLIDSNFYGTSGIISHKNELKQLGVKVDFKDAVEVFLLTFRKQASLFSITKENVLSFLSCCRKLRGTSHKFPLDVKKCIQEVNWLRTRLGDYRSPSNCILFGPEWLSISPITLLPFLDDSDNFYGKGIHEYQKELKSMGIVAELKAGVKFVVAGLYFPLNPCNITPKNVFSLLDCIQSLLPERNYSFPEDFQKKAHREWLKTYAGYRTPDRCCLFNSEWGSFVKPTDGPFINEEFYGSSITLYREELDSIGVAVDVDKACSLLASLLDSHTEFATIVRVYNFLSNYKWKPDSDRTRRICIPDGCQNCKWVKPEECVLHDKDGLFNSQLIVLEKYYDPGLLYFFSCAFNVKSNPSFDDYYKLWKVWESLGRKLSHSECCAFWEFVVNRWSSKTQTTLTADLMKLPVVSGSGEILLFDKRDVFIADDLLLKDLFKEHAKFVWYPQMSLPSLPRTKLLEVYGKIEVRTISESVLMEELSLADGVQYKEVKPSHILIGKGLVRLILGFLANPAVNMDADKRREAVQALLHLTMLETSEPITVSYSLSLSSGETVKVTARRMIRWDRESSKFFAQKLDRADGHKILIEYATFFAEVIAKGVLWEKEECIIALSELIKLGFLLDFNDEAVQFLMMSKNLQIFKEDEELLADSFPSN